MCRLCTMPCASSCNEEAVFLRKQLLEHRRERAAAPGPAVFLSERNFDMKPQTFTWKKLTADELTRVYLDDDAPRLPVQRAETPEHDTEQ